MQHSPVNLLDGAIRSGFGRTAPPSSGCKRDLTTGRLLPWEAVPLHTPTVVDGCEGGMNGYLAAWFADRLASCSLWPAGQEIALRDLNFARCMCRFRKRRVGGP